MDFTQKDKYHLLDLFVNNEKTLLKIYEALFPHRTANILGSEQYPGSNLNTGQSDADSRTQRSPQFNSGFASQNMAGTFLPSAGQSNTAGGSRRPTYSQASNNVSKSLTNSGYQGRNYLASAAMTARNQQMLDSLKSDQNPLNRK